MADVFITLLLLLVVWFAGKILLIAFGGLLLAVLLSSLARWVADFLNIRYGIGLAIVVILGVALATVAFLSLSSRLVLQANEFTEAIPRSLRQIRDYLKEDQWGEWILEQSPEWGRAIAQGSFPSRIGDLASSLFDLFVSIVIMGFIGLYGAAEPNLYSEGLIRLVPIDRRNRAREVFHAVVLNLRWWLLGQLFAMVVVGLITGIGMHLAGVRLVLTLAVMAGVLEIIPTVGPVLWLLPASLIALTQGPSQVANVAMIYAVTHLIESYILIPLVQRRTVLLPPVLSILAVVLLGLLGGFLGLLVAAPISLVAMVLVKMLYVEDRLGDHDVQVPGERRR